MVVFAADAKEFMRRSSTSIPDVSSPSGYVSVDKAFYTALGSGVVFKNEYVFNKAYYDIIDELAENFKIAHTRHFYCSTDIKKRMDGGDHRAVEFCEELFRHIQDYIEFLFVSYAIFPPSRLPSIRVGGNQCPAKDIPTPVFLRNYLPQMFPHLTAWEFTNRHRYADFSIHLDSFQSKQTLAWRELTERIKPEIFTHGDECNPYISVADIAAFLTDTRLSASRLRLDPRNIIEVWDDMNFSTQVRFIDEKVLSKVKWQSDINIDLSSYLSHPVVFLMVETPFALKSEGGGKGIPRFNEIVKENEVYDAAVKMAQEIGGSVQFFDKDMDRQKIRDNDILVYIGRGMEELAYAYSQMYDVETITGKELRRKMK